MKSKFAEDYYAYTGEEVTLGGICRHIIKHRELRYIFYGRMGEETAFLPIRLWFRFLRKRLAVSGGNEITFEQVGKGLTISHGTGIIINMHARLGEYVSLRNGVTIGAELRGSRAGNPKIGNRVWIGSHAVLVGNITIGDDVLIAPLSYVNRDVPSHSVVVGNPARIIPKEQATEGYIKYYR